MENQEHQSSGVSSGAGSGIVNWNDYNFPPCINVVHFSIAELNGGVKRFVLNLYLSFLILVGILCVNLLSTFIQAASHYDDGINVLYSFLNFFVFLPAGGFTFYKGYFAAVKRPAEAGSTLWYRLFQAVLSILWFVFSIVRSGCFNGWMRISKLKRFHEGGANFCIFLTVLESLGFTAACILGVICLIFVGSVSEEQLQPTSVPQPDNRN